jgi:hypothetical protein
VGSPSYTPTCFPRREPNAAFESCDCLLSARPDGLPVGDQLPAYTAEELPFTRVERCDACGSRLNVNAIAPPVVRKVLNAFVRAVTPHALKRRLVVDRPVATPRVGGEIIGHGDCSLESRKSRGVEQGEVCRLHIQVNRWEMLSGFSGGVEVFIFCCLVRRIQTEFSDLLVKQPPVNAKSARSFCFVAVALLQSVRNPKLLPLCDRIV